MLNAINNVLTPNVTIANVNKQSVKGHLKSNVKNSIEKTLSK